jgi:cysteine desulfurase/selenocysteine lyase
MTSKAVLQSREQGAFELFREGFPALKEKTYLSVCDKMILHNDVRKGIEKFLDHLSLASANRVDHEVNVTTSKEKFARLINVDASTIAAVRNVSDGVNTVAWAMPMSENDNVVLCMDSEHPNNIYPWLRLKHRGNEVRMVDHKPDGSLDIDAIVDAIDVRTKLVTCSSVTFAPGHRTDLMKLGEACQTRDVFLLVDGVQSAGILNHDLSSLPVDGFATSSSKGLLGLYGYGFLYISPKWIDRLEPAYLSRAGVQIKADDHSVMGGHDYELQLDSRRFEVGSFNYAGAYATDVSLGILLDLGMQAIEDRVLPLATALNEGIAAKGLASAVPSEGPGQSHIVTFGALDAGGHGFSTDPMITPISEYLAKAKVIHTIRRGQIRFAIHAYNNEEDIEHAVECVGDAMKAL